MRPVAVLAHDRDPVAVLEAGIEDDAVAGREVGDSVAERLDDPGAVGPEDPRLGNRGQPLPHPDVEVVERRRMEPDEDLARPGNRIRHLLDPEHVGASVLVDPSGEHGTILSCAPS